MRKFSPGLFNHLILDFTNVFPDPSVCGLLVFFFQTQASAEVASTFRKAFPKKTPEDKKALKQARDEFQSAVNTLEAAAVQAVAADVFAKAKAIRKSIEDAKKDISGKSYEGTVIKTQSRMRQTESFNIVLKIQISTAMLRRSRRDPLV